MRCKFSRLPPSDLLQAWAMRIYTIPVLCVALPLCSFAAQKADVVIYGGSSGGITAAIQTARMGKNAILIEPSHFLGGLTTGGLGATDIGNKKAIGGLSLDFYTAIREHYKKPENWKQETPELYFTTRTRSRGTEAAQWTFEPKAASAVYAAMLESVRDRVTVVYGERLDLKNGVRKAGAQITEIVMESGKSFSAEMYIDASYEGDLMAKAGVAYHVGREANSVYNESINGVQAEGAKHHQFTQQVDPYVRKGDPSSGLLPGINPHGPGLEFSGDQKIQAYNFRMCTTDVPENRRDWEKPAHYDPQWFELALRNAEAGDTRVSWNPVAMPNRKTDTNNNFAVSSDFIGMNWDYPEADYATRERIWKAHEDWQKGLFWTLANSPRVPEKLREAYRKFGLAKDEFTENDNWPRQLYVREARRMIGDYVMTEKNCKRTEIVEDSVGMGAYNMDSHHVQRYVTKEGFVRNEGDIQIATKPYPISFRSIRPKATECTNLLVPVCLSASHIAYGSIRMEPVFMVMGQSAATAAVQAIEQKTTIQRINLEKLKTRLLADNQVLDLLPDPKEARGNLTLTGIVVDDTKAQLEGFETEGAVGTGYLGTGYRHDGNTVKGQQKARYIPELASAGRYRVAITYTALGNRANKVPVVIHHAEGETTVYVNQQEPPSGPDGVQVLGSFQFDAGKSGWLEIRNEGTKGHVIADAAQWLAQ